MSWRNRVHSKWRKISVIGNASDIVEEFDVDASGRLKTCPRRQKRRILHSKCIISSPEVKSEYDHERTHFHEKVDDYSYDFNVEMFPDDNDVSFSISEEMENSIFEDSENLSFFGDEYLNNCSLYSLENI